VSRFGGGRSPYFEMKSFAALPILVLAACQADPPAAEVTSSSVAANELARASAVLSGCMGIHVVLAADVLVGEASLYFGPLGTEEWRQSYVTCLALVEEGCADASACGIEFFQGPCEDSCEAGVLTRCGDDGGAAVACESLGGVCFEGIDCIPAGAATCAVPQPLTCDGDVLTGCHGLSGEEGFVTTFDCAAEGGHCVADESGDATCQCSGAACAEDVGACDPSEKPTCYGSVLGACTLGERTSVDCTALGFTSCTPGVGCAP
jgi:hypothetical protein